MRPGGSPIAYCIGTPANALVARRSPDRVPSGCGRYRAADRSVRLRPEPDRGASRYRGSDELARPPAWVEVRAFPFCAPAGKHVCTVPATVTERPGGATLL